MSFFPKALLKKYLPRTLFGRSLMIILVPALLLQIITTIVFFDRHWSKMTSSLADALAGDIAVIAGQLEDDASSESLRGISAYAAHSFDLLISFAPEKKLRDDQLWISHSRSFLSETLQKSFRKKLRRPFSLSIDTAEKWIEISVQLSNGVLYISSPQRRLFTSSGYVFLLWVIFATMFLFAIAILFMRNQIRPIRRLAVAAERFGKGRDVPSFKPEGAREVRQAAVAFLEMHERVKRQVSQRTTMLAGISHDLRTPLTRIRLQLAMLENSPEVEDLKSDVREMEQMLDGYLAFARGEGGEQIARTDIGRVLERIAYSLKKQGKNITLHLATNIVIPVRKMAFERCLSNLINNAVKHAHSIWVEAEHDRDKGVARFVIDDDGPGIPEKEFEEVFKPFTRLDEARNAEKGGVGLGLPIAKDIVTGHGGHIYLEKSSYGGLRVIVEIPE